MPVDELPPIRQYRTVLRHLKETRRRGDPLPKLPWRLPLGYVRLLGAVAPQNIDMSYRIHGGKRTVLENLRVYYPLAKLGEKWMVFANTRNGDGWALSLDDGRQYPEVGFIDHARGGRVRRLGISLKDWLRVAYFSRECTPVEATITTPTQLRRAKRHVRTQLESISPGLTRRFPNTFF